MNDTEIEKLLRKEHDLETPRPGLEQRIHTNLESPRRGLPLGMAGALAALVIGAGVLLYPKSPSGPTQVVEKEPESETEEVVLRPVRVSVPNPLEEEAVALEATARKTMSFLLSRFPSLPEETS
ncbi:MAG: hypothetical protein ACSHYB_16745 [Roseibacillus sp.]